MEANKIKLSKRNQRIYNDAYNNPNQINVEGMKDNDLAKLICDAVTQRRKDEVDGVFKFKN